VRLAVLDADFRGWQALLQQKKLPAGTTLVDLTTENRPDLLPAPYDGPAGRPGHGTLLAQAAALAAPDAALTLIRIDPVAPYQLAEVVRYINGGEYSAAFLLRRDELLTERTLLARRRAVILNEREAVLNDFTDETELKATFGFLGPVYGWLYSPRVWHLDRMRYQEEQERVLRQREYRLDQLRRAIASLRGVQLIVNPFQWNDGYPLGSSSPLSHWLDASLPTRPIWFQPAGDTRGQAWLGDFRTTAGHPVLEFAPPDAPLPAGRWSRELNFLGWQPHRGDAQRDLPDKTRIRLSLQWREPHDPEYYLRPGEDDLYRRPLAPLTIVLLRQRDPEAKTLPADTFEVVARTTMLPQRLDHQPGGAIYEQVLEFTTDRPGRYAVRIEKQPDATWVLGERPLTKQPLLVQLTGLNPTGIRPLGVPTLPEIERRWELRPRLFVATAAPGRGQGRAVLADFWTDAGTIGVPADARTVISVGAADVDGTPRASSSRGAPPFMELAQRPTLWSHDALTLEAGGVLGTDIATAYAAGTAAALLSTGLTREQLAEIVRRQHGQTFCVPAGKE
jgi:hypothetical protein